MKYQLIASRLLNMKQVDQEMRGRALSSRSYWDSNVDQNNTASLKMIVRRMTGWPTISDVGAEAADAAWLIAQHADHDPEFQLECLDLMKAAPENEVPRPNIARLEDRVRLNMGKPQLYGTQFDEVYGVFIPRPIEDLYNVDDRRKAMGLGTLSEGLQEMYEKYHPK